ncbi:MAG: VapC toxin family PIN domain ribonuclease [Planctomycetes bacterium]|nr:VapC toxin family PIN domain ribonuclease [Planctomycetota bacterium]
MNVRVALFDGAHVHHEPAHRWLATTAAPSWATCPLTENGLIRVLSNPAYPTVAATPEEAASRLNAACGQPGHEFWSDDLSLCETSRFDLSKISGHKQITDVYLAGLAVHRRGRLATFDANIPLVALVAAPADVVELIPTT